MTAQPHRITVIPGDGVGPEVVRSAQRIIAAAGVAVDWEEAEAGAEVFKRGDTSGVPKATRASIERTRVVLKGPLETPVGFGEKSANVTLRKLFETYANVRPARELPGVPTRYAGEGVDMIIVRENIEDLYAGIEHMQTQDVAQCLKIITRKGSEKIIRYAFELARREGRAKVTCATKANIMKLTEGLFKRTFEELSGEYPEIAAEHLIIDNVAHQMAKNPAQFDVVVTTNLNGDIISDLASGLVGGLGFAPSGNYGDDVAIFEAVHGSAPKYAGKDVINPTALILSSLMMLRHVGEAAAADHDRGRGPRHPRGGEGGHAGPGPPDRRRRGARGIDDGLHRLDHREPREAAGDGPAAGRRRATGRCHRPAAALVVRGRGVRERRPRDGRRRPLPGELGRGRRGGPGARGARRATR